MTSTTDVQADHRELLLQAYAAYNSQNVEDLLALVSDNVDWPDDDGGRLHGKAEVRPKPSQDPLKACIQQTQGQSTRTLSLLYTWFKNLVTL